MPIRTASEAQQAKHNQSTATPEVDTGADLFKKQTKEHRRGRMKLNTSLMSGCPYWQGPYDCGAGPSVVTLDDIKQEHSKKTVAEAGAFLGTTKVNAHPRSVAATGTAGTGRNYTCQDPQLFLHEAFCVEAFAFWLGWCGHSEADGPTFNIFTYM